MYSCILKQVPFTAVILYIRNYTNKINVVIIKFLQYYYTRQSNAVEHQSCRIDGDRNAVVMWSSMSDEKTVSQCRPALESFRWFHTVPLSIALEYVTRRRHRVNIFKS